MKPAPMHFQVGLLIGKMVVGEPSAPGVGPEVARGGMCALLAACSIEGDVYM